MPPAERREYSGIAPPTTLAASITNVATSVTLADGTGWPSGVVGPFFAVIDRGLPTEEKAKFSARTGNVLTVASGGRGVDGTGAASHSAGAAIEHVVTADDLNILNQHVADATLDHHTQYLTNARHDVVARHSLAAIGYAGFSPGDLKLSAQTADHEGWLLCDGREVSTTTYPNLAFLGTTWGAAAAGNVKLPDARGRNLIGAGAGVGLTARSLGASFGAETLALVTAHLPSHTHAGDSHSHTVNSHSHGGASQAETADHSHGYAHDHAISHWHTAGIGSEQRGWTLNTVHTHDGSGVSKPGSGGAMDASGNNYATPVNIDANAKGAPGGDNISGGSRAGNNTGGRSGAHTHALTAESPGTNATNGTTGATGSGTAIGIMNPSLAVNVFIKT